MLKLVNQRAIDLTGYSEQELLSVPFSDIINPADRAIVMERYLKRLKGEELPSRYPFRVSSKDGNTCWFELSSVVIDWEGRPATLTFLSDVTERKKAEEALIESEERFRLITETIDEAFWMADVEIGKIFYVSPSFERIWGRSRESLYHNPRSFIDAIHVDDRERVLATLEIEKSGLPFDHDYRILQPDGNISHIWDRGFPLRDENGRVSRYVGVAMDVTERKRIEKALQESEEKYQAIFDESVAAVYVFDNKKNFINSNQAGLDLLGYKREELLQMSIPDVDADPVVVLPAHQEILSGGRLINYEHRLRRKDETIITVINNSSPLTDLHGNVVGMISTLIDVTESKKAEEALIESEEKYRKAFFTSPDSICITRPWDGTFVSVNKGFTEMTGYTEEDVAGKTSLEINIWKDPEDRRKIVEGLIAHGEVRDYEARFLTKTGEIYGVMSASIIDLNGVPHILNITHDITGRKRVEKTLQTSNERYKTISEMTTDFVFSCIKHDTGTFTIDWMAGAVERITGYTIDELVTFGCWRCLVLPEDALVFDENVTNLPTGTSRTCMLRIQTKHGDARWLEVHTSNNTSSPNRIFGGCRDITKGKQAEELVRESENKFTSVFNGSPVALTLSLAIDGKFVNVNDAFLKSTGYTRDDVIGTSSEALGIFANNTERERLASSLREHHVVEDMEISCRTKTGEIRPCLFSSGIIQISGKPHILSSVIDNLARKKAEEDLRDSEMLFREIFDKANDAIFLVETSPDGPGKHSLVNERATRILGYSREEFLAMSPRDIVPGDDQKKFMEDITKKLIKDGGAIFESANRRKDGSVLPIEVSIHRFHYKGRDVDLSIVRDITERKRAEEALALANKKLTLLSGITRHDINNQLTALVGYICILEKKQPDTTHNEYFQKIATAAQRISSMIKFTKEYEEIGVHAPIWQDIRTLADTAAKQAPLGKVIVNNDLPSGAEVFADPLIVKVFYNLMDNAVQYGGKITTIRFSVEEAGNDHVIVCEDDGEGVAAEEKEKIFERGFGKNTGMGLALSREIFDITGISIRETGVPGAGTRFEMTVPKEGYRLKGE